MRLIDADKIVFTNCLVKSGLRVCCHNEGIVPKESIEMQPTVKAIPIEWIKKWCLEHYPTYPRIITEQLLKKTETWQMIEDWEKENECNNKYQ